jgi:RNA polymerase sigma factor (sigma-70 family)
MLALAGDNHLVDEIRAGNEVAFEIVYERYGGSILSFCRHMLGSPEEAEDAVQHTFAAAHGDLGRDHREIRLRPWLYAIARNRCLSVIRSRRDEQEAIEVPTAGLDERVRERAELRDLLADLRDLPDQARAALLLAELRDLSHAEIAEVLGCEAGQVKGIVFRARSSLIERRDARDADCSAIRAELESARKGALRRGRLRHHLASCPSCTAYLEQVRGQRKALALLLPVVPTAALKETVLGAAGVGAASAAGGGIAGSLTAATVAKVAAVTVLAGGAGLAGERALEGPSASDASRAPTTRSAQPSTPAASGSGVGAPDSPARTSSSGPRGRGPAGRRRSTAAGKSPAAAPSAPGRDASGAAGQNASKRAANSPVRRRPAAPPGQVKRQTLPPGASQGKKVRARGAPDPAKAPAVKPRGEKPRQR